MSGTIAVASRSFSRHPVLRKELLERHPGVSFNDEGKTLAGDALVAFLKGHQKAITAMEKIDDAILAKLPELRVISKFGVGLDMIDLGALERRGVRLAWTGGTNKRSVSELVLLLALALLRRLVDLNAKLRGKAWLQQKGACLTGRTFGLVGCGNVGRDLVALLKPFGCRVLAYDQRDAAVFYAENGVESAPLERLLRESDIVSLHLPLTPATAGILNAETLALLKPTALVINTARGGLIDEEALKARLKAGLLGGAAFDVFATEPPEDAELLNLPNFIATPHIGGSTEEAILAMGRAAIAGLDAARPAREFASAGG